MISSFRQAGFRWRGWTALGLFVVLAVVAGGCQTSVPRFVNDTLKPALGIPAVGGQWEPELEESDAE